jgi:hypothetical protein
MLRTIARNLTLLDQPNSQTPIVRMQRHLFSASCAQLCWRPEDAVITNEASAFRPELRAKGRLQAHPSDFVSGNHKATCWPALFQVPRRMRTLKEKVPTLSPQGKIQAGSKRMSTISGFVPTRNGGPHVPAPQFVKTSIRPRRCSPCT